MEGIQLSVGTAGRKNDISIIKVGGYIDTTTSAELERSLDSLLKANSYNIIIDLGNVDYISSAGWGIFISEIKRIREKGGDLKLVKMIPDVYEVFELLEFHYILKAFDTIEEALEDFDRGSATIGEKKIAHKKEIEKEIEIKPVEEPITEEATTQDLEKNFWEKAEAPLTVNKSIEEKIRTLVLENPENGSIKIMKELDAPRFGNTKLSWFQVRKYLRKLGLNTKKKRIEYFKKSSFKK